MTRFITTNNVFVWALNGDCQYILLYNNLPVIEQIGKGYKFVLETVFGTDDNIVDMIHNNTLAICYTEYDRPDMFVEENVILSFYNCVEIDRKILSISMMGHERELVIMQTTFISGKIGKNDILS